MIWYTLAKEVGDCLKAIIQNRYGGVEELQMTTMPDPKMNDNDVLIKMAFANVASGDMRVNMLKVPSVLRPIMKLIFGFKGPRRRIRGISGSGTIIEVGSNVTKFNIGDKVYFINSMNAGALAEYIALSENSMMAHVPSGFTLNQAAPLAFGAMSALHFINTKTIKPGYKVLIYGASGSVGTYAVQLAKFFGAEVTAICSKRNHDALREIGADYVIDYHGLDYSTLGDQFDVVFDAVMKLKKTDSKQALKREGKLYSIIKPTSEKLGKLLIINRIIEEGQLVSVIDKEYLFEDYKRAHQHVYDGHKLGNVVIKIEEE